MKASSWKAMAMGDFVTLQRGHDLPERQRVPVACHAPLAAVVELGIQVDNYGEARMIDFESLRSVWEL